MQFAGALFSSAACPALHYFSTYLINRTILEKKLLNIKYVFRRSLQLLSEIFFIPRWTERDMIKLCTGLNVKYPLLLSDYNETWIVSKDLIKKPFKYQISWKSVQWEPSCSTCTDGRTDGRTDVYTGFIVQEIGLQIIILSKSINTRHPYSRRFLQKSVNLCPSFPPYSDLDFSQGLETRWKFSFSSLQNFEEEILLFWNPTITSKYIRGKDSCPLEYDAVSTVTDVSEEFSASFFRV